MRRRVGRPGLMGTMARTAVIAGTATAVSGNVQQRQAQRAAQQPPAQPAPVPASSSTEDRFARLRELGELKTAGLLTEEEFAAEKAKILAG